jgi:molybdopterin-guanine dinucleotide biosynthesis protein A
MTPSPAPLPARTGAILLAGGRGSRMGGEVKPLLEVDGRSLLRRAVEAVGGCASVTVVAPLLDPDLDGVTWVREEPPFGGPAAGLVAALEAWQGDARAPEWTVILACDLVNPDAVVAALAGAVAALGSESDGVCLDDDGGRPQWLAGLYRTAALEHAARALPDAGRDASLRTLLGALAIAHEQAPRRTVADVDTWQDLDEARARAVEEES